MASVPYLGMCHHCYGPVDNGNQKWCRTCLPNPTDYKWRNLLKLYDLTQSEYEAILNKQEGKCKVDGCTRLAKVVDHNHSCCPGKITCGYCVRGIVCVRCNVSFQVLEHSLLDARLSYLEESVI